MQAIYTFRTVLNTLLNIQIKKFLIILNECKYLKPFSAKISIFIRLVELKASLRSS